MNAITEFLITLFESIGLYSTQNGLGEHLRGLDIEGIDYSNQSVYVMVFLCLFIVNLIIIFNYYFGILNRIPFNRFLWWLSNVIVGATILFFVAFLYANNDLTTGNIYSKLSVTSSDCVGFGFTAAIYSILWSLFLSVAIKWKSSVNKKVPF